MVAIPGKPLDSLVGYQRRPGLNDIGWVVLRHDTAHSRM
jgi:hypothetical protein